MCTQAKYICTESKYICTQAKYICTEAKYICTQAKYICTEGKYTCTEGKYICTQAKYICTESKYICTEGKYTPTKNKCSFLLAISTNGMWICECYAVRLWCKRARPWRREMAGCQLICTAVSSALAIWLASSPGREGSAPGNGRPPLPTTS